MKTITEYGAGCIGEMLRRGEVRAQRRTWWRRLLRMERAPRTHVARLSEREVIYSPGR